MQTLATRLSECNPQQQSLSQTATRNTRAHMPFERPLLTERVYVELKTDKTRQGLVTPQHPSAPAGLFDSVFSARRIGCRGLPQALS